MRISPTLGVPPAPADRPQSAPPPAAPVKTALPAVMRAPAALPAAPTRPQAALLAQLVATAENLPATRIRRRAEPAVGIACYQAIAALSAKIR